MEVYQVTINDRKEKRQMQIYVAFAGLSYN